jgi:hypothetical protein
MRHLMFVGMLIMFVTNGVAQEETLLKGDIKSGGFGGPVIKFTSIHNQSAVMVGGRGGWIINHSLVIGGGGYGVVNEIDAPEGVLPNQGPLDIEFGYAGLELEYIFHPQSLLHFSIYTLFGGGDNHFVRDVGPVSESNQTTGESDFVFVLEPAVNAELNVTKWFRLNAGISYRLVTHVEQEELDESDFSGMAGILTFKFGKF